MTNPNDPNNPFGGQDNNPFGGGYGNNSSNSNNQNPADSTGSTSYGQGGYGQSGQNGYGQSGSSSYGQSSYGQGGSSAYGKGSYGQGGSSAYGQSGSDQFGSTSNSGYGDSTYGQSGQNGYGQSGSGYDQSGSGYGAYGQTPGQDGYGQNSYGQAYAPGPGFQHPENDPNASESGRPLQPTGGSLPIVESIPFAFKRLFSKNWHVYIGFTVLMMIASIVALLLIIVPVIAAATNDPNAGSPNYNLAEEHPFGIIAGYLVMIAIMFVMYIVLYNTALRDSRGEEPSWGNLFKNIRWGQVILVHVLLGLAVFVIYVVFALLMIFLSEVHVALGIIVFLLMIAAMIAAAPVLNLAPFYVYDGRTNAVGAFKMAWQDAKPHFLLIVVSLFLISIACSAFAIVTIGFGMFALPALQALAYVFIYRWISAHRDQPNQAGPQHPESPNGYMSMY